MKKVGEFRRPWWDRRRASRPVLEFLRFSGQSVELSGILPQVNFIKLFFIVTEPHFLKLTKHDVLIYAK